MTRQIPAYECDGVPDTTKPGIHWDESMNTFYVVSPSGAYTSWVDMTFGDLFNSIRSDDVIPYEEPVLGFTEIRGLGAHDLKEMLAMAHESAAVELVKRFRP